MAEAEIVKHSNKSLLFRFFGNVLAAEQWDNKALEGRKNIAGIQEQPELLFWGLVWTQKRFP